MCNYLVVGSILLTKRNMAFSGASCILFLMMYINWATERERKGGYMMYINWATETIRKRFRIEWDAQFGVWLMHES